MAQITLTTLFCMVSDGLATSMQERNDKRYAKFPSKYGYWFTGLQKGQYPSRRNKTG